MCKLWGIMSNCTHDDVESGAGASRGARRDGSDLWWCACAAERALRAAVRSRPRFE